MNDTRKQEIQDIVAIYTNRYACAQFCDRMADVERYSKEANDWMLAQRTEKNITPEEMREAIAALEPKPDQEYTPFAYDTAVMA